MGEYEKAHLTKEERRQRQKLTTSAANETKPAIASLLQPILERLPSCGTLC